jgi:regulator of RNase E activity RraA
MTGKYRVRTIEINGEVDVAGVRVSPDDIVYADDDDVCFMPREKAGEILAMCKKKNAEDARLESIEAAKLARRWTSSAASRRDAARW